MNERKSTFQFQKFSVVQHNTAMKVGTDAVLLGAWADISGAQHILDAGTGCGIIALMAAQRNSYATIHGIEPEPGAVEDARYNFSKSPWNERLSCSMETIQQHEGHYDTIITNPPFFSSGPSAQNDARDRARSNQHLRQEELLEAARRLLTSNGKLHLILPVSEGVSFMDKAGTLGFFPERHCMVFGNENAPRRRMMTFGKQPGTVSRENITIRVRGKFTDEYKKLTSAFYLRYSD